MTLIYVNMLLSLFF